MSRFDEAQLAFVSTPPGSTTGLALIAANLGAVEIIGMSANGADSETS